MSLNDKIENFENLYFDPFEGLPQKDASRALQTFFRTSFRTHVSLAAMADRKANIMLRMNSLLLSGAMIFYKNILDYSKLSMVTLVIFLLTTLLSLIFAALVSRPHRDVVTKESVPSPRAAAEQIFFFNHFVNMQQEDYERAFGMMMRDAGLIYRNMAGDLYRYGKVIDYKYRLLRFSYNIFVFGLVLTLLSFFVSIWLL